jgi:hypothetical protein
LLYVSAHAFENIEADKVYNSRRPHTGLDRRTPDQAYFNQPPFRMAA